MKKIFFFSFLVICATSIRAQNSEIGPFMGTSFYIGDLTPTTIFSQPQLAGGIIYRYNINPRWAIKANLLFAKVKGSDYETNDQYARNLSFQSPITEISVQGELNFFNLPIKSGKFGITPYICAGISVFSFNPQAELDGTLYSLQHLGTEGQGLPGEKKFYSLTHVAIPFGLGVKMNIGKYVSLGVEWGMRYTFTDYLDDVGNVYYDNDLLLEHRGEVVAALADRSGLKNPAGIGRGNVKTKDMYSFLGAFAAFKFGNSSSSCDIKTNVNLRRNMGKKY
jgi:hypothetical protein